MKVFAAAALACTGIIAFGAYACETPAMITMPDGKTATFDQMMSAQKQVKKFVAEMNNYMACFDKALKASGDDAPAEYKSLMDNRHNSVIDEMQAVAGAFNVQVRAYQAAHKQPAKSSTKSK